MKYYIRYVLITGLSQPEFYEEFDDIKTRWQWYRTICGAGYELVEFGTNN